MTVLDQTARRDAPATDRPALEQAARNRRLGWILFGIFAALAAFSTIFIDLRSVGH